MSTKTLEQTLFEKWQQALLGDCRIDLSTHRVAAETVHCARLYTRNEGGRWTRVDPILLPPDGGGRAELLDSIKTIIEG